METSFGYDFIVPSFVLTVPMRNGNSLNNAYGYTTLYGSYRTYEEWKLALRYAASSPAQVLTVPMRNGNSMFSCISITPFLSSYRTYEEWKQQVRKGGR